MTDRIEAIRERHAARLARIAAKQAVSTAMDDDMAVLLAALAGLREEWAASDVVSVELEQWPTSATIRAAREAAHLEFVHDGDDVLLHRYVSDWAPVAPDAEPGGASCGTCGGSGVIREQHDGGDHPVHCPCTYRPKEPSC